MGIELSSQGVLTVELPPEPELGTELDIVDEVVRGGACRNVVVDFSVVDIVTSSSISKLLKLNKLLCEFGHRLILCNAAPATEGIFKVTGLNVVFDFADDETAALALIKN